MVVWSSLGVRFDKWPACTRRNQAPNPSPIASAHATPKAIAHHSPAISNPTSGVKYSPSAVPITHCPVLRNGVQLSVGAPSIDTTETPTSGPIIQGIGVCKATQTRAESQAHNKVIATRCQRFGAENRGNTTV